MSASLVAYESLTWASEPKSRPGTTATRAASSRKPVTSSEPCSVVRVSPCAHVRPKSPATLAKA